MSKSSKRNYHVVSGVNGGWAVRSEGQNRGCSLHPNQREAIAQARKVAKAQRGELYIHGRNGQIRERDSYGSDPFPPKGAAVSR